MDKLLTMCLIAFAWNVHRNLPLVLAANRDEFHARPSSALGEWRDAPGVFGGRDVLAGGSWLALNAPCARLAAVTNVRERALAAAAQSRGALVRNFVNSEQSAAAFAKALAGDAATYGPFNLLLWDGGELIYTGNRPAPHWRALPAGIYGLSNGELDEPWPKVRRAKDALHAWIATAPAELAMLDAGPLFRALADEAPAIDAELPDTGIGLEFERRLAPLFIRGEAYGTRASSVVLIAADHRARFAERRFGANGTALGATELAL